MQKKNVLQLQEIKIERFYQQKNSLVNQLQEFISERLSPSHYQQIKVEFKNRAKIKSSEELSPLFDFWLYFFYRYENGLRGIEWFLAEKGQRLSDEELVMVKRWIGLKPKLVQAIDKTYSEILFLDFFTKEKLPVSNYQENIPFFTPWYSTLGLLEPFDNLYYFNGVRRMTSPKGFHHATMLAQSLMRETGLTHEEVLVEYYPELLYALQDDMEKEDVEEKEFIQYNYKFLLQDKRIGENFLYNEEYLTIETWEDSCKKLVWLDDLQIYQDSELDGKIQFGEVLASLELREHTLTFISTSLETVNLFLRKLQRAKGIFQLQESLEEKLTLPIQAEVKQVSVMIEKDVPEYFPIFAQQLWTFEKNEPIPMYDHLSLRELVEKGKGDKAELWLKQAEYQLYLLLYQQYGKVEVTADFNTVRRQLGLELSPFVTGGMQRHSELLPVYNKKPRVTFVLKEDIPVYDNLGFLPETVNNFYAKDLIAFYKEKTNGASVSTKRKYENSLYDIREFLESSAVESWNECDSVFWQKFLEKGIYQINETVSKTKLKDRNSTVKALIKWLEKEKNNGVQGK
jgi:hypothetical protein